MTPTGQGPDTNMLTGRSQYLGILALQNAPDRVVIRIEMQAVW